MTSRLHIEVTEPSRMSQSAHTGYSYLKLPGIKIHAACTTIPIDIAGDRQLLLHALMTGYANLGMTENRKVMVSGSERDREPALPT